MRYIYTLLIVHSFILSQSFGWQDGGVPIRQGAHIEWGRTGDVGDDGNIILGWSDTRSGDRDVYAQKIDSNGNELWGDGGLLVVSHEGRQEDPIMITDGAGGFYVIWSDFRNPPTSEGQPYAQHVSSDGSLTWDADGMPLSDEKLEEFTLNMCKDGNGGAYVTWKKKSSSHFGSYLNQSNSGPTTELEVISSNWSHSNPSLETAGNGGAMMVWSDERNGNQDIYGQRLEYNGTDLVMMWETIEDGNVDGEDDFPIGGIPISIASGAQSSQKVTYYSEEYSVVVWQDERNDDGDLYPDIYATFIDVYGEPSTFYGSDALPVVSDHNLDGTFDGAGQSKQTKPRVKANSNGAFVIWNDFRSDDTGDIYIQKITHENNGVWQGTSTLPFDGIPVSEEENEQLNSRLTVDGNDGVFVVWENESNQQRDIKIKHIDSLGNSTYTDNGMIICDSDKDQISPLVVRDGNGGAFTVWEDQRDGSKGLYVQHVDASGSISLTDNGYQVFYGIDFNGVLYDDTDPLQLTSKSLYLDNDQALIFWQDGRGGNQSFCSDGTSCDTSDGGTVLATSYVYGQVIDLNYGDSGENNGSLLSTFPVQKKPSVKAYDNGFLYHFVGYDFDAGEQILTYEKLDENFNSINESSSNVDETAYANQKIFVSEYDLDGNLFVVYSKEYWGPSSIWLQVYGNDGNELLSSPINIISSADGNNYYPHELLMSPSGTMVLIYDQDASDIKAIGIDQNGILWDDSISIISNTDGQEFQDAALTDSGIFITWKDFRNSNNDIFAQHISFTGEILSSEFNGISLCEADNDQTESSLAYLQNQDIVTTCWEDFRNGTDWDIFCREVDLYNHSVKDEFVLSDAAGDQKNPFLFTSQASSIITVWEDSRSGTNEYSDIYAQELVAGQEFYTSGGIIVSDGFHNQINPKIDILSNQSEVSYLIYWDDMRSSGKEDLINIFSQKLVTADCSGDNNGTAWVNNCGACVTEEDPQCVIGCDGVWADNNQAAQDLGCGCGLPGPVDYYVDNDGDGLGAGDPTSLCDDPGGSLVPNSDDDNDECSGTLDDCGVCNGSNANKDCAGVCFGSSELDDCGVCGGDGPEENFDCDGNCETITDCSGTCGGADFSCWVLDESYVGYWRFDSYYEYATEECGENGAIPLPLYACIEGDNGYVEDEDEGDSFSTNEECVNETSCNECSDVTGMSARDNQLYYWTFNEDGTGSYSVETDNECESNDDCLALLDEDSCSSYQYSCNEILSVCTLIISLNWGLPTVCTDEGEDCSNSLCVATQDYENCPEGLCFEESLQVDGLTFTFSELDYEDDGSFEDCSVETFIGQDCASTWGGDSVVDECGVCDNDSSNDNLTCIGCTDQSACNYDENAIVSGDCVYAQEGLDCDGNELSISDLLPSEYLLMQNYPNPFNPSTLINFNIPKSSMVSINIFNINGNKVKTLIDNRFSPGYHQVSWSGYDDNGISVPNGIYFYIMETPDYLSKRKMIFIK